MELTKGLKKLASGCGTGPERLLKPKWPIQGPRDICRYKRHRKNSERDIPTLCSCDVKSGCSRLHSSGWSRDNLQSAAGVPMAEVALEAKALRHTRKVEMTQRSMGLPLFPARWQADRYSLRDR